MTTAAAQLRRILHLIPALADDREHSVDEVAALAGVDRRTLLGDLRALAGRADLPGGFVEGFSIWLEGDSVSVHASHFLRPMRLTRSEVLALDLGLGMLHAERPPEEHHAIAAARERLRDVLAKLPGETVATPDAAGYHAETGAPVDATLLATMRAAARERRKVQLAYRKPGDSDAAERVVSPYAMVFASGMWYLVAHCERSEGLRIFRTDRVAGATPTGARFEVPAEFSVADLVRDGRAFAAEGAGRLLVRYSPRVARWISEREGRPLEGDGSLTIEYPLADLDWAVRHVLQYGPDAEIIEPPEARAAIGERLRLMRSGALPAETSNRHAP